MLSQIFIESIYILPTIIFSSRKSKKEKHESMKLKRKIYYQFVQKKKKKNIEKGAECKIDYYSPSFS